MYFNNKRYLLSSPPLMSGNLKKWKISREVKRGVRTPKKKEKKEKKKKKEEKNPMNMMQCIKVNMGVKKKKEETSKKKE